jgi:hypothetical protein
MLKKDFIFAMQSQTQKSDVPPIKLAATSTKLNIHTITNSDSSRPVAKVARLSYKDSVMSLL